MVRMSSEDGIPKLIWISQVVIKDISRRLIATCILDLVPALGDLIHGLCELGIPANPF